MRWRFGIKIFTKEYGIIKKLFGSGFNHLNWYGFYFENDKTMRDYPHNPFISILLYSGLLGVALYIHLLIRTFKYYLIYLQNHLHLFIFFLITLYFCFFSSENPFDPPMMGFFVALPFFSRHIELKILRDPL
jgi:O-antigen ligase